MWVRVDGRKLFMGLLAALIAMAWLSLWAWGESPYGRFLSHEELLHINLEDSAVLVPIFVVGWTLMTVAMMLPTSLPMVMLFHAFTGQRPNRLRLVGLLVVGYLGVWTLFGIGVHLGDWTIHQVVEQTAWLEGNYWLIGPAVLIFAGLYQFTPLKYHCLDKCRSPLSFIMEHWRGRNEEVQAFRLGIHHGLFCLGCCWSLMLVMFAVGIGSISWMLALGALMAIEKNMPWGRRLSMPLGVFLIGWGLAMIALTLPVSGSLNT